MTAFSNCCLRSMASVLLSRVQLRQGFSQDASGFLSVPITPQQHALGERQLVAVVPRQHVQVDVGDRLESRAAVVDHDVVAVGVQARLPGRPRDPLAEFDQVGTRLGRGVGQVDGVALGDDQGVAAGERADIEYGQVVVVFVDPDGRGIPGNDFAEHACHVESMPHLLIVPL
jgi:hypothetical protein